MTFFFPQCVRCARLTIPPEIPDRFQGFTCAAFPDGVPNAIVNNRHKHTTPYPGDNGMLFEPVAPPEAKKASIAKAVPLEQATKPPIAKAVKVTLPKV